MNIRTVESTEEAQQASAERINQILQETKKPILFLISVSTIGFSHCNAILSHLEPQLFGLRATIGVLDEKCSDDDTVNTFAQLTTTEFYKNATGYGTQIIDTYVYPEETMQAHVIRFEEELEQWRENNPEGMIITLMSIGSNGSVAGIMPNENEAEFQKLWNTEQQIVGYDVSNNPFPRRVTTTPNFLREIDYAIVFVDGYKKILPYREYITEEKSIHKQPAQILKKMKQVEIISTIHVDNKG